MRQYNVKPIHRPQSGLNDHTEDAEREILNMEPECFGNKYLVTPKLQFILFYLIHQQGIYLHYYKVLQILYIFAYLYSDPEAFFFPMYSCI